MRERTGVGFLIKVKRNGKLKDKSRFVSLAFLQSGRENLPANFGIQTNRQGETVNPSKLNPVPEAPEGTAVKRLNLPVLFLLTLLCLRL